MAAQLGVRIGQLAHIVGELALEEVLGIRSGHRDQTQVTQVAEGAVGGEWSAGETDAARILDFRRSGLEKGFPFAVHGIGGLVVESGTGAARRRPHPAAMALYHTQSA